MQKDSEQKLNHDTIKAWVSSIDESQAIPILGRNALRSVPAAAAIARVLNSDRKNKRRLDRFITAYLRLLIAVVYDAHSLGRPERLVEIQARFDEMIRDETGEHHFRFGVLREAVAGINQSGDWKSCVQASVDHLEGYLRGATAADGNRRSLATDILYENLVHDSAADNPCALPLWIVRFQSAEVRVDPFFRIVRDVFGFNWFAEWYQGFLDGKPKDWELQRRVALIEDAIWEAGPVAVAEEIERIRKLFALEQEVESLKDQLNKSAVTEAPAHRLHNQPPEALDDEAQIIRREITLVWGEIEELEAEIAKPDPSPSRLDKIAKALWAISLRIAKYCGSVADIVVKESAKEFSKTGTKLAVAAIAASTAAQNEGIQSVAKAIWELVKTLPPG